MTKARDLANAGTALTSVSATELGYLDGVTSAVQTQMDAKLATATASTTYQSLANNNAAGKNKIINGDFAINQRSFSSTTTSVTYGFDRWQLICAGGTSTYSAQTFTAGTAPVAGYESTNFARLVSTGQSATSDRTVLNQRIEDVRTFAGQTITLSFWAKASTGTPSVAADIVQGFGTGGSTNVETGGQKTAITTSWARYSFTYSIASIAGKTIGTNNVLQVRLWTSAGSDWNSSTASLGIQSTTIDFWGVQVEAGNVATAFQTATGTLQGELAACQRYYWRSANNGTDGYCNFSTTRGAKSTTVVEVPFTVPVQMRVVPTIFDYSTINLNDGANAVAIGTPLITNAIATQVNVQFTTTGLTQYRPYGIIADNSSAAYVAFSAEL